MPGSGSARTRRQARACSRRRSDGSSLPVRAARSADGSGPSLARMSHRPSSAHTYSTWVGKNPNSRGPRASRGGVVVVVMARPYEAGPAPSWTNATSGIKLP